MKKHHATIVLAIVFCTGVIILWWADKTGLDRDDSDAILPALAKVAAADIKRLEILESKTGTESAEETARPERIVFERRDEGRWQMIEPFDVAADPSLVETLAQNLKALRRSPDVGTIHDPPEKFGLEHPAAIVRFYGTDLKQPLGGLEIGESLRELLYVQPEGSKGIEVIDTRLLGMLKLTPNQWRDKSLFHMPSFRVGTLVVTGPGRDLKIERDEGHWQLLRPLRAVAENDKVEGIVAELTSLQVANGEKGFVANDVTDADAAKYGLDKPSMTIELSPALGPARPQTLVVGNPESGESDHLYARLGDQNDVLLIDGKGLRNLGLDPLEYRSKKVVELNEGRVEFLRLEAFGRTYDIARTATGWEQIRPAREPADASSIKELLSQLGAAQASALLDPAGVPDSGIDAPSMTLSVWQAGPLAKPTLGLTAPPKTPPRVALQIGRSDPARKLLYARLVGDKSLMAIPNTLVAALPSSPLAFRERTVLTLNPAQILRLAVHRAGTTYELTAPTESGKSTSWQMVRPVEARADEENVTKAVVLLSSLHCNGYVADQLGDGKAYGLHAPVLAVTWTTPVETSGDKAKANVKAKEPETRTGTLRIGARLPKSNLSYANIEGSPVVFTLSDKAVEVFEAEFHSRRVLSFAKNLARRLVLRWPGRTLAFKTQENPDGKGVRWVPEDESEARGFDASRLPPLVSAMANLITPKLLQYAGPIPAATGLDAPRLVIEVYLGGDKPSSRVLRIGRTSETETIATNTVKGSGPVFLLTGPSWADLVNHVPGSGTLPDDVFVPESGNPSPGEAKASRP